MSALARLHPHTVRMRRRTASGALASANAVRNTSPGFTTQLPTLKSAAYKSGCEISGLNHRPNGLSAESR
jgi:hypothetical protein